ncbi:hypothetical protein FKM82_018144, partial [Ascaphus truei]
ETCSGIALEVLRTEGTVVDAGIAAALCLAVVHPHTASIGGVFSSLYYNGTSSNITALNAMPLDASPSTYGIPLMLQGLWLLHQKHGRMKWSDLLHTTITLANRGFLVDTVLSAALEANRQTVLSSVGLCSLFCAANNNLKGIGAMAKTPQLGKTLVQIATAMTDAAIPDGVIQSLSSDIEVSERQSFTKAISKKYLRFENPVTLDLPGITLHVAPSPTAGKILADSLREIYQIPIPPNTSIANATVRAYQILLNSSKVMYALGGARPSNAPASFSQQPLPPWRPAPVGGNVVVADTYGNIFVMSLSLNSSFGSGFVSPSTGILLSDFTQGPELPPASSPMFWACPSVLQFGTNGDVMGLAATGGSSVPFSLAQVILNHLYLKEDLTNSVRGPLVDLSSDSSDPWTDYFGVWGRKPESVRNPGEHPSAVVAVEVEAEHVKVSKSLGLCCYDKGM